MSSVHEDKWGDHWVPATYGGRWVRLDQPEVVLEEGEAVRRYGVRVTHPDEHGPKCIWAKTGAAR